MSNIQRKTAASQAGYTYWLHCQKFVASLGLWVDADFPTTWIDGQRHMEARNSPDFRNVYLQKI